MMTLGDASPGCHDDVLQARQELDALRGVERRSHADLARVDCRRGAGADDHVQRVDDARRGGEVGLIGFEIDVVALPDRRGNLALDGGAGRNTACVQRVDLHAGTRRAAPAPATSRLPCATA